jgi:hypothetical protein
VDSDPVTSSSAEATTVDSNDEAIPAADVPVAKEEVPNTEKVNEIEEIPDKDMGNENSEEPKTSENQEIDATLDEGSDTERQATIEEDGTTKQEAEDGSSHEPSIVSLRDEESEKLGKEVFFHRNGNPNYSGWDNLRWMSYSGTRQIEFVGPACRFVPGRRTLFWSGDQYVDRVLAVYREPHLILILRPPEDLAEVLQILDLPPGATVDNAEDIFQSYLVVENVVDPKTCKLRLSPLTTFTSVLADVGKDDFRRRSCFELVNPTECVVLSAVRLRKGAERALTSFTDSGAYLETTSTEHVLQKSICDAHRPSEGSGDVSDQSWKHQIILGTLHSHVVLGNQSILDMALSQAKASSNSEGSDYLEPRIIDAVDESGRTPLHYACSGRFSGAVSSLVRAGANVDTRVEPYNMTPCHVCALHLDAKSLQSILTVNKRPNVIDSWGRTPMYLAMTEGRSVGQSKNPAALDKCLSVLEAHGGHHMEVPMGFRNPVSALAAAWSHEELEVILKHIHYRYPVVLTKADDKHRIGISVSAFFQYPVHSCLITARKRISDACNGDGKLDSFPEKSLSM